VLLAEPAVLGAVAIPFSTWPSMIMMNKPGFTVRGHTVPPASGEGPSRTEKPGRAGPHGAPELPGGHPRPVRD
jgi:hypothetical protein